MAKKEQSMGKLQDIRTPIFWAEGHPGPLAAEGWQVRLGGLVEKPVTLTYEEILALPKSIADARLTSVSGWSVRGKWGGVRLSDLLALADEAFDSANLQLWVLLDRLDVAFLDSPDYGFQLIGCQRTVHHPDSISS